MKFLNFSRTILKPTKIILRRMEPIIRNYPSIKRSIGFNNMKNHVNCTSNLYNYRNSGRGYELLVMATWARGTSMRTRITDLMCQLSDIPNCFTSECSLKSFRNMSCFSVFLWFSIDRHDIIWFRRIYTILNDFINIVLSLGGLCPLRPPH